MQTCLSAFHQAASTQVASCRVPLSQALRSAIADTHRQIESTATAREMIGGRVGRHAYVALLAALAPVHAALDERIAAVGCAPVPVDLVQRGAAIESDLTALGGSRPAPGAASRTVARWIASLRYGTAIGAAYVVAGSRRGSAILRPLLARSLGLTGDAGLRAHEGLSRERWAAVCLALDAWESGDRIRAEVVDGACGMMDGLLAVYGECHRG